MKEIILASASPRRKEILSQIKLDFRIIPSDEEENLSELTGTPEQKAEKLAFTKAQYVSNKVDDGIIIGADTIVVLDDCIFGKPKDDEQAYEMLSKLSNREHFVITAVAVVDAKTKAFKVCHEKTIVKFSRLTHENILDYIKTKEPCDKAGAYAIQGIGAIMVEKIDGCYYNVVGLPISKLCKILKEFDVRILVD